MIEELLDLLPESFLNEESGLLEALKTSGSKVLRARLLTAKQLLTTAKSRLQSTRKLDSNTGASMTDVKTIFSEKKFPSFIANHSVFKTIKNVEKVFPEIGLPNTEKEIEVDNKKEALAAANALLIEMRALLDKRLRTIDKFSKKKPDAIGKRRSVKLNRVNKLLSLIRDSIADKKCLVINNGRVTLNLPSDILDLDGKVAFKSGEGILRVYNKLNDILREGHFLAMTKIDTTHSFKEFSSKNVPALKYKVRFSSDGAEGLWDIATMSMRGISSCQSWASAGGGHSSHVVGSCVDPFTGIIYLTNGGKFNDYGSKMIRRCVVRFLVNNKTKVPFIGLEHMYPSMEQGALDAFTGFLKERTDNKFDVVYLEKGKYYNSYVPMSKVVAKLTAADQPYRDSGIGYGDGKSGIGYDYEFNDRLNRICIAFSSKVMTTARAMKLATIPEDSRKPFSRFRNQTNAGYYVQVDLSSMIQASFANTKRNSKVFSEACLKDCLEKFVADKLEEKLFNTLKTSASKVLATGFLCYGYDTTSVKETISDDVLKELARLSVAKLLPYFEKEIAKIKVMAVVKENKTMTNIYSRFC